MKNMKTANCDPSEVRGNLFPEIRDGQNGLVNSKAHMLPTNCDSYFAAGSRPSTLSTPPVGASRPGQQEREAGLFSLLVGGILYWGFFFVLMSFVLFLLHLVF